MLHLQDLRYVCHTSIPRIHLDAHSVWQNPQRQNVYWLNIKDISIHMVEILLVQLIDQNDADLKRQGKLTGRGGDR